jgi:phosphoglycerol transferase
MKSSGVFFGAFAGQILRREWYLWLTLSLVVFVLASFSMSGFPAGIIPNVSYPFVYAGDGLSHSWMAQRAIEGWIFDNDRSGYPFGSDFRDYPGSDAGNLLILKVFGWSELGYAAALNLFFLFSFSAISIASYVVLRTFGVGRLWAGVGAISFAFAPFHFQRLSHLFYASYFVVPIYFYYCALVCAEVDRFDGYWRNRRNLLVGALILGGAASFGVYFAFFGAILLCGSGILAWLKFGGAARVRLGFTLAAFVAVGVAMNIAPNILHRMEIGPNAEVAKRSPVEAEIYGFKPAQLVLPQLGHRVPKLAQVADGYAKNYPLVNENHTANLGFLASLGGLGLVLVLLLSSIGKGSGWLLIVMAWLAVLIFVFGVLGGAGYLFSAVVSPSIRGWNRISIFLQFACIVSFVCILECWLRDRFRAWFGVARATTLVLVLALIFVDQTKEVCIACNEHIARVFEIDKAYYRAVEEYAGEGGAVYQLPYIPFPESPNLNGIGPYDLLVGFLHTKTTHWSSGGMKGRPGDLFFRSMAQQPFEVQVEIARRLGFKGIQVDRRAYVDSGADIVAQLSAALRKGPSIEREFGEIVFFELENTVDFNPVGRSASEIYRQASYSPDGADIKLMTTITDGFELATGVLPSDVLRVSGLSDVESWGRWSDARLEPSVEIHLAEVLPSEFTLVFEARGLSRSGYQDVVIEVGSRRVDVSVSNGFLAYTIPFTGVDGKRDKISFRPLDPVSPSELGTGADDRKLGIGLVNLRVIPGTDTD